MSNIYITGDKTPEELSEIFNGEAFTTERKDYLENSAQLEGGKLKTDQIPTTKVPTLDTDGKIQESQLPESLDNLAHVGTDGKLTNDEIPEYIKSGMRWKRTINVLTDTLDPIESGNYYKVSVGGVSSITGEEIDWKVGDAIVDNETEHQRIPTSIEEATSTDAGIITITGDIGGTQNTIKVVKLQGVDVTDLAPSDGDILKYSESEEKYELTSESDDTIQGSKVSNLKPVDGTVLMYDGDGEEYIPSDIPDNTIQGNAVANTVVGDGQAYIFSKDEDAFVAQDLPDDTIQGVKVSVTQPTNTQILAYDTASGEWTPTDMSSGTDNLLVKSFIIDCTDTHGGTGYMGIRSVDYYLSGTLLTPAFTAYATSVYGTAYAAEDAFDTTTSKTGQDLGNSWVSGRDEYADLRLICVFDDIIEIDEIKINNYHSGGNYTNGGANNVKIYTSEEEITDTTYGALISGGVLHFEGVLPEHISSDVEDDINYFVGTETGNSNAVSIQGVPVSEETPTDNNVLKYNSTLEQYDVGSMELEKVIATDSVTSTSYHLEIEDGKVYFVEE